MTPPTPVSASVRLRVPFHDVDAMKVVWHGHYLKYFEVAREALSAAVGLDLMAFLERTGYVFPVVRSAVKHVHPLRYGDELVCTATVVECHRRIVVTYVVAREADGVVCARGSTEQVAVRAPEFRIEFQVPEEVRTCLGG